MSEQSMSTTAAEAEAAFLEQASDLLEKSAASAPLAGEFISDEASRLEDRGEELPEEEVAEEMVAATNRVKWGSRPVMRNQAVEHPDSVRLSEPETKILDLSDTADLAEFNRLQRENAVHDAPSLCITELDKQKHEGNWVVFLTFCKIEYMQL